MRNFRYCENCKEESYFADMQIKRQKNSDTEAQRWRYKSVNIFSSILFEELEKCLYKQ